jgi:hypothetical protein
MCGVKLAALAADDARIRLGSYEIGVNRVGVI